MLPSIPTCALVEPGDELVAWGDASVVRELAHTGCPRRRELSDRVLAGGPALHARGSLCCALQPRYRAHRDDYRLRPLHQRVWDDAYCGYSPLCGPTPEGQSWRRADTWPIRLHLPGKFVGLRVHDLFPCKISYPSSNSKYSLVIDIQEVKYGFFTASRLSFICCTKIYLKQINIF
jgi:hypothetical protein